MKMYHIAIVPSNYPIFFAVHCGYTPPPPFSICLLHICIIIRYMYYAAYNTDFAVVIGIKAVLNLSETVARYLLSMNIYTIRLIKNNDSRILRDLIIRLCVL